MDQQPVTRFGTGLALAGAALALALSTSVLAEEETPDITLFGFEGGPEVVQSMTDPLLLYVVIGNGRAAAIRRENTRRREILEDFTATPDFGKLSVTEQKVYRQRYAQSPVPEFALGSPRTALESLISFMAKDAGGNEVQFAIRPLRANDHEARTIQLDEAQRAMYRFVVEPRDLQSLRPGEYQIVATVDTSGRQDMWAGWFYSRPLKLALHSTAPDPEWSGSDRRQYLLATVALSDQQFATAENQTRQWVRMFPDSVDAWASLGKALEGQNRPAEALQAFNTAVEKFRKKYGNSPQELPDILLEHIERLEQASGQNPSGKP